MHVTSKTYRLLVVILMALGLIITETRVLLGV